MELEFLKQMAGALAVQFGDDCEIVIHDLTRKSVQKSIVYIEHGHVTNRKVGDGPSRVVLEALKKDPRDIGDHLGYLTKTEDGKVLKSSTVFVRDHEDGPVQYIFSINYDITRLLYMQESIRSLISAKSSVPADEKEEPGKIQTNVADLLDDLIAQSIRRIGRPASLMTKEEKASAIHFLNDSGAFLITKAGDKIAKTFGISKYTLYSYLKTNENE